MGNEIGDQWARFERWATRFRKSAQKFVESKVYLSDEDMLFVATSSGMVNSESGLSWSKIEERVSHKIAFLRGYLVDISFDGPDFMVAKSQFLTNQYPSQCERSFGIWLEQDLGKENLIPGDYFGFQEFEVSIFINRLDDIDFASIRAILPFDRMIIRQPNGVKWTVEDGNAVADHISNDLEDDLFKTGTFDVASTLLQLDFTAAG